MREEFFDLERFDTIEATQAALDLWVADYNTTREHQSLGDQPPIRRFELARKEHLEVIDGGVSIETVPASKRLHRRVDDKGRIGVLRFRYHVGRAYAGQAVGVSLDGGLLHVHHNDVLIATHAKRHLAEDDEKFTDRPPVARPTRGDEVLRQVDPAGVVSFAGTGYRAGNAHRGRQVGVRIVGDTVQITLDGHLLRTHKARHDKMKEFSALAQRNGKPRRKGVA